ncbi:MAG: putative ribonucleotide transport ATP-binding protein mkl [Myxococcota bacterium]|nr:putative ribonucleotide transport ATP-binding protein mkl [Myxococcota bacterium]
MPAPSRDPLVRFVEVRKAFGPKVVYENLTLSIYPGETLTILGGSGTGKSVALKLLIGLLRADSGAIYVDGQDIVNHNENQFLPIRKRISMLFQSGALFDSITVGENVAYPLREHAKMSDAEIRDVVAEKLEWVGLPGIEKMKPADLSGGMRKRVALARAIAGSPEIILYDEPTTGLDPINTRRISELILSIQDRIKVTSVVVTHDMACAFIVSDRMAMLANRRVVAELPAREFQESDNPVIRDFIYAMSLDKIIQEREAAGGHIHVTQAQRVDELDNGGRP